MEPRTQVPALSPSPEMSPPARQPVTHSTPAGPVLGCSPPSQGGASCLCESPEPVLTSRGLESHPAGVSPMATARRRRRLSTIRASGQPSGAPSDLSAPGEELGTSVPEVQLQQPGISQARSWLGNTGLPGIPSTAKRSRRHLPGRAAAMERVRQWEMCLLQDIEEAVQHELAVEVE